MTLESLLILIETLRSRIDAHGAALKKSEALTRYVLINPLLRELGWDTEDPAKLRPEYGMGDGRGDYVLMKEGEENAVVVIESKSLGTSLSKVVDEMAKYLFNEAVPYFAVTDGQCWEVYETHKPVALPERLVASFDVKDQSPAEVCLKALALWRPSAELGHVAAGSAPVVTPPQHPPTNDQDWQPLTGVSATKGVSPVEILLPDGRATQVKNWAATLEASVRWLTEEGILQAGHCPIIGDNPRAFRYMVHTQPIHSNGDPFKIPMEVNGLWVEKLDNHNALIKKTITIIKHVGQAPAQFKVRFSPPPS